MSEFGRRFPGRRLDVDHLLYLPDHELVGPLPSSIDPDRIVELFDARPYPASARDTHGADPPDAADVHALLSGLVDAMPSVDAMSRLARNEYRRLSGGLATWARRLELQPHRLRVIGTAGSGKTQLALEELRAAEAEGQSALYVCFNRTLADAMRRVAPVPETCNTFHELGAWLMRERGDLINYAQPDVFDRLASSVVEAAPAMRASVDLLIVDEGQDFQPEWAQAILQFVRPDGRCLWLEDPSQNLYRRAAIELPGWAVLRSPVNYRSPHVVVGLVNALELADTPMEAGGVVHGFDPPLHEYATPEQLVERTSMAVRELRDAGHSPADIAVISWHGRERSRLIGLVHVAGLRTRRFTGQYTGDGQAILADGEPQLEILFRFKGQAADCVVIAEVDFDEWTDDARRRLFVGLTCARLKVSLVASSTAAGFIADRLG